MTGISDRHDPLRRGESRHRPISLLDDDEIQRIVDADEAELNEEINRIEVDLTQDDENDISQPVGRAPHRSKATQRNFPLQSTHQSVEAYTTNGFQLKVNDFIELVQDVGDWRVQFLEVKRIWVNNATYSATIRGIPYSRNRCLMGRLECKLNEVCQVLEVDSDDARPDEEQAMMEISPRQVLALRTCNKTNASYPQFRFGDDPNWLSRSKKENEEGAVLTCRWKMRVEYRDARFREAHKPFGGALIHFTESDVKDQRYRISDEERRGGWRGTVMAIRPGRRPTFADTFCGAGGASCGATREGFEVRSAH